MAKDLLNPFLFEPKELDLRFLRELPEINIGAVTGIPEIAFGTEIWRCKSCKTLNSAKREYCRWCHKPRTGEEEYIK